MKYMLSACIVALGLVATLFVSVGLKADTVRTKMEALQRRLDELEKRPVNVTETWTSGAKTVTVSTDRKKAADGSYTETAAEWRARHAADVADAKTEFPPTTGG